MTKVVRELTSILKLLGSNHRPNHVTLYFVLEYNLTHIAAINMKGVSMKRNLLS